ncbi:unnamed protein product [Adineta steineri]|uniref:G-protein coupled receptors family 1 profile domain-containing protein n=1 Tax=Adineta steineri TaxID=433720 RepID=A0A814PK88_9BILA|nr:unnamed protein product [Adineta steineri]
MKSSTGTAFYRLTINLIIIIGCFICYYFPHVLLSLILNMGYIDETYNKRAIREITDFFVTLNSATNFAVYFSVSYTFRRAVLRLVSKGSSISSMHWSIRMIWKEQIWKYKMKVRNSYETKFKLRSDKIV